MDRPTQEVKDEARKSVEDLKSLLDEARGRLRNAGSDTKEALTAIGSDAEQLARDMTVASSHAFADLIRHVRQLVNRLGADLGGR